MTAKAQRTQQTQTIDDPDVAAGTASAVPDICDPAALASATPSMARFLELKSKHPDCILWYRMGDFYELFFDDAVTASAALGIALTKRGKHLGQDIPMCGVPAYRSEEYLHRLIAAGYRVAVCEQLEDPAEAKKRGSKSVVQRDVVRIVTPGTLTEDALLEAKAKNYLTSVYAAVPRGATLAGAKGKIALASLDISTGELQIGEVNASDFASEIARIAPSEILMPDAIADGDCGGLSVSKAALTPLAITFFDAVSGERELKNHLGVADLAAYGTFTRHEMAAVGGLLKYVSLTQLGAKPVIRAPIRSGNGTTMMIDAASRISLELVASSQFSKISSLLWAIDRTVTGAGARELAARLTSPLAQAAHINDRLDVVSYFVDQPSLRDQLRTVLRSAPDVARASARLALGRGGPRDLGAIRDGLNAALDASKLLSASLVDDFQPSEVLSIELRLKSGCGGLGERLTAALADELPITKRDGGFVRVGYSSDLDEAHSLRDDSQSLMARLEARYAEVTGVKSLKVRHNNILGYFIEVSVINAKPLQMAPHADVFRHRQTMANAMRFTTTELVETEGKIASATARSLALEQEVYADLALAVRAEEGALSLLAAALGELDTCVALAHLAEEQGYVRPKVDQSRAFAIEGGRHPVVEQALAAAKASAFIENSCNLSAEDERASIWLVTGPNMAGKSTFLRQNALIAILAQMGSFVPAKSAHIGVVDRLFSRVGASDDLARGRSTFMVEMVETAAILNQATDRSLIILDEVGRGTATFDGLSIAWAALEYLYDRNKARALFATHYQELTALAGRLDGITNVTMDVAEWHDNIVFLHRVKPGAADRSYGIQVAKLAGLPGAVVTRARQVLARLEKSDRRSSSVIALSELPLFAAVEEVGAAVEATPSAAEQALADVRLDEMSPKEALDFLYHLKSLLPLECK